MRRFLLPLVAALLLGPAAAQGKSAAPPPARSSPRSAMVFVGAQDRGAEASALKLGGMVEEALGRAEHYTVTALGDAAGERVPADAREALHTAGLAVEAGQTAFEAGKLDEAQQQLEAAVKAYEHGAAGLYKMDDFTRASGYLAAVYQAKHRDDDAKDALTEALAVKPAFRLEGKLDEGPVGDLLRSARRESNAGHKGSASLFTTPPGGKVFVDGELKGYGPLSLDRLPVGKHFVRFERAGYMNVGQMAEVVSTDDIAVKARFVPTHEFAAEEEALAQALKEVDSPKCGPATFSLLDHYRLERAIFANVSTTGDNLVLDLSLVDGAQHRRIAHRRNSFQGEEPDNIGREVRRLVSGLLADADAAEKPRAEKEASDDPLDSVSGMEDWGDEDDAPRKRHKSSHDE